MGARQRSAHRYTSLPAGGVEPETPNCPAIFTRGAST
jgi:hypothetical protein